MHKKQSNIKKPKKGGSVPLFFAFKQIQIQYNNIPGFTNIDGVIGMKIYFPAR